MHAHDNIMTMSTAMGSLRSVMAAASLSALLWRGAASSSRPSLAALASRGPAFQDGGARRRHRHHHRHPRRPPLLATAFSSGGGGSSSFSSSASSTRLRSAPAEAATEEPRRPIPTILLAGFLGSGKTSTLKHLLENNASVRIGTIVNDVASVNIDAKLIANSDSQKGDGGGDGDGDDGSNVFNGSADGVVELQNGCACCSLADELMTSVVRLTKGGERELDAIVVELSGVADPVAVRENWEKARAQGHPATRLASLSRTVTLVDACTFGTDWMTWDTVGERESWVDPDSDECVGAAARQVPELLAEQVEAADLLLVNKVDLAGEGQTAVATGVARGLNGKARVREVEFGRVGARELLGQVLEEEAAEEKETNEKEGGGHSHEHGHSHDCDASGADASHSHSHSHEASARAEPECADASHSHSHAHSHDHASGCDDADCTDPSHSHSHEHASECDDADCTDPSHSHAHSHDHEPASTAADQLGITSFVYSSSTPFNSQRLLALLNRWPVPIKDDLSFGAVLDMADKDKTDGDGDGDDDDDDHHPAFKGVLRSKGFCWMAPADWSGRPGSDAWRHDTAMYWSHAGKHFGITTAGKWWGTLTKEQVRPYFANNPEEYERILREDWISEEWGDRRQELVFIGSRLDEAEIRAALDECLCTDEEMAEYRAEAAARESGRGQALFM